MSALDQYNDAVIDYQAATTAATPALVNQWMQADTRPREVSKGVWTSVYQTQRTKGMCSFAHGLYTSNRFSVLKTAPTQAQIYQRLMRDDVSSEIENPPPMPAERPSTNAVIGAAQFISTGLQLQRMQ